MFSSPGVIHPGHVYSACKQRCTRLGEEREGAAESSLLTLVQFCPLWESSTIWISSITATSKGWVKDAISMVHDTCVANGTLRFSCPVYRLQYTPWLFSCADHKGRGKGGVHHCKVTIESLFQLRPELFNENCKLLSITLKYERSAFQPTTIKISGVARLPLST